MSHVAPAAPSPRTLLFAVLLAVAPQQHHGHCTSNSKGRDGQQPPFGDCDELVTGNSQQPPWKDQVDTLSERAKTYMLQRVGLQASGIVQPRDPTDTEAGLCLTAGEADQINGMSLFWSTCQGMLAPPSVGSADATIAATVAQEFHLDKSGHIRKQGLCIRRMMCGKTGHTYDLGPCDGLGEIVIFKVMRPAANNMNRLMDKGSPIQAVAADVCRTCGPYVLLDKCRSDGGALRGSTGCGGNYHPASGWTKKRSQYVGDAAVQGRARVGAHEGGGFNENSIFNRLRWRDVAQEEKDFAGLASTADEGVCGSFVGDGASLDSIFFFHRIK